MPAGARTLTQRELNRALLARQGLLERWSTTLPRALERMGGLQAQYAPSMYIGLWSRVEGFERDALTRALERRTVVQGTLMRATIHLVSPRDYWPFAVAVREARREWWLRATGRKGRADEIAAAAERLRAAFATHGAPLRRAEVEEIAGKDLATYVGLWIDLVRVPPSGTWERRRADLFAPADEWLGPAGVSPEDALDHTVSRYLASCGPASRKDIADWAGLPVRALEPAVERIRLRRFRAEDGAELLDVPRAPIPDPDSPAPARFLPTWDGVLLVHARRTGILPEEHRLRIFSTKNPHSFPTFLVDGAVAGTWKHEKGRIRLEPFGRLDAAARAELEEEADRLAALHA